MKVLIISILIILTVSIAYGWTTRHELKATYLGTIKTGALNIHRFHDEQHKVTCWTINNMGGGVGSGISCVPDERLTPKKAGER